MFACFALKQGISRLKYQAFTATTALFFQIKTCGFHLLEERGGVVGGDVPALAVW